jgi:hypothetical protein
MRIAILAWGSLIWDPRNLKVNGAWKEDGPLLPVEFARISQDLRLTLVIRPSSKQVKVLYIESAFTELNEAIKNLQERERCTDSISIGFVNFIDGSFNIKRTPEEIKQELTNWNATKNYDAIIWTDLGQNFRNNTKMEFNIHNAKRHLSGLKPLEYEAAKNYILKAPEQIKTQYRKQLIEFITLRNDVTAALFSGSTFFNVHRENLLHYYPEIVANSKSQFDGADSLAADGKYGMGISHLLISTEEMIKALVVVMDAQGFDFRKVKGMDIFFKNHEVRFFISFLTFILTLFADDGIKILKEMKDNPGKTKELANLLKNKSEIMKKMQTYLLRKLVTIKKELVWFSKAEAFRQNGFYVDAKGNLISPLLFTEDDYNETRQKIEKINKAIQGAIDAYLTEDKVLKIEVENIKVTFHNEKFYTLIENELANRRAGKATLFDKFQKFLLDFIDSIKDPPPGLDGFKSK